MYCLINILYFSFIHFVARCGHFPPFLFFWWKTEKPKTIKIMTLFIKKDTLFFFNQLPWGEMGPGEITFKYYHKIKKYFSQMP